MHQLMQSTDRRFATSVRVVATPSTFGDGDYCKRRQHSVVVQRQNTITNKMKICSCRHGSFFISVWRRPRSRLDDHATGEALEALENPIFEEMDVVSDIQMGQACNMIYGPSAYNFSDFTTMLG